MNPETTLILAHANGLASGKATIGRALCPYFDSPLATEWERGYSEGEAEARNGGLRTVRLGRKLFEFNSYADYTATTLEKHSLFANERLEAKKSAWAEKIYRDSNGCLLVQRSDFARAAYPVQVFLARPELP